MDKKSAVSLFSTAYFPPIQYFTYFLEAEKIIIEGHDNYIKQTYRNRCKIYSPNGIQVLSVPVERGSFHKVNITSLKIDYSRPWQENHLRTMETSYNSSAFYEFYIDEIRDIILKNHKYLIQLNTEILEKMMSILGIDDSFILSESYISNIEGYRDFRNTIHPKKDKHDFIDNLPEYFQVFSIEKGFIPNLSILDLIFNMGPESYSYLINCKKNKDQQ